MQDVVLVYPTGLVVSWSTPILQCTHKHNKHNRMFFEDLITTINLIVIQNSKFCFFFFKFLNLRIQSSHILNK
jgi:hypothetical protein